MRSQPNAKPRPRESVLAMLKGTMVRTEYYTVDGSIHTLCTKS